MSIIKYICYLQQTNNDEENKRKLTAIMKYMEKETNLPIPTTIELALDESPRPINGWDFDKIQSEMVNEDSILSLENMGSGFDFSFVFSYPKIDIRIDTEYYLDYKDFLNVQNVQKLIKHFEGDFESIQCLEREGNTKVYENYFEFTQWSRTPNMRCLSWLQYYNHDELRRQGGDAILENPYIKAERLCGGILVQVGESLEEAYSPEGQELLVKATKAMPPVQQI